MVMLGAECLMLDANSQYNSCRSKEEKENKSLRLRVSAVIISHFRILQNSEAFLPQISIRGVVVNA
jgi:hypothetical protein